MDLNWFISPKFNALYYLELEFDRYDKDKFIYAEILIDFKVFNIKTAYMV